MKHGHCLCGVDVVVIISHGRRCQHDAVTTPANMQSSICGVGVATRSKLPKGAGDRHANMASHFTAQRSYASAVLGVVILSVRPFVRLSHACFVTNAKNLPAIFYTT